MAVELTHIEIHASDPVRAAQFYQHVFGWRFTNPGPDYHMWTPENGPTILIFARRGVGPADGAPVNGSVFSLAVDSIDLTLAAIAASHGRTVVPKYEVPGFGWVAYCKDTEGNIFGIAQPHG